MGIFDWGTLSYPAKTLNPERNSAPNREIFASFGLSGLSGWLFQFVLLWLAVSKDDSSIDHSNKNELTGRFFDHFSFDILVSTVSTGTKGRNLGEDIVRSSRFISWLLDAKVQFDTSDNLKAGVGLCVLCPVVYNEEKQQNTQITSSGKSKAA